MKNTSCTNKKIGIVTLFGNVNFGNKLQNFAVQELLTERGWSAETIVCKKKSWNTVKKYIKRRIKYREYRREVVLAAFSKKHLTTKTVWRKNGVLNREDAKQYEYLAVGSDQVWNPGIRTRERDTFLLRFAKRNQRICISPSIGMSEMPDKYRREFAVGLQGFPYLSCRERDGTNIIETITGCKCEHLLDPTLVIPAKTWRRLEEPVDLKGKHYIMLFFLGAVPDAAKALANRMKEKTGAEIIVPSEITDSYYAISPFQFVYLIDHADCVLTDSFHATAFSINLNTRFYVYDRVAKSAKDAQAEKMNSRILSLTQSAGLYACYASDANFHESENCTFEVANRYLENERVKFHQYLDRCLNQKEKAPSDLPETDCTGCGACALSCPTGSISMKPNAEGFFYPVIDYSKCINCGKCATVCPAVTALSQQSIQKVYAASNREAAQLERSASGAIFPALAEQVLSEHGAVVGAYYDATDHCVKHKIVDTLEGLEPLRTSKYVQSCIVNVLAETRRILESGRQVLFTGTPCQIAGLKGYLKKDYSNLVTCDCSCHGVPSPGLWEKWIEEFQRMHRCKVTMVSFRDQSQSDTWGQFQIAYQTDFGKLLFPQTKDMFFRTFSANISLRRSCYHCAYKGWNRFSDITLADFWGINRVLPEAMNPRGTSMLLVHTEKGEALLVKTNSKISAHPVENRLALTVNRATWESVSQPKQRSAFFGELQHCTVSDCVNKYAAKQKLTLLLRVRRKIACVLRGKL